MAYYSFYKIFKDLIYTFIKYFKKSNLKIFTIFLIILICIFFYISKVYAEYTGPYDKLLENSTINSLYTQIYQINNSDGFLLVKEPNQYNAYLFDINSFKIYTDGNDFKIKNTGTTPKQLSIYLANNDGSNLHYYSNTWVYTGNILTLYPSLDVFAFSGVPVYTSLDSSDIWYPPNYETAPYISNISSDITSWGFTSLEINGGTTSPYFTLENNNYPYLFNLQIIYNDTTYLLDINDYVSINENTNTFTITIPRLAISSLFNFNLSSNISFNLLLDKFNLNGDITETITYNLDTYTFTLTQNDIDTINQNSLRYKITENSNVINNINTSINNDNIPSNSVSDFNNIDNNLIINDTTSINTIFDNIYNAFTTKYNDNNIGYGYTLSLPVPFTNKTIDISPHTIYGRDIYDLYQDENKYNYPGVQIIYRFIVSLWWFVIGLFILKDVRGMINKIAEGNIEDVSCDVKKELL